MIQIRKPERAGDGDESAKPALEHSPASNTILLGVCPLIIGRVARFLFGRILPAEAGRLESG